MAISEFWNEQEWKWLERGKPLSDKVWHKFSEEDPPLKTPILVTDGKVMVVGIVIRGFQGSPISPITSKHWFYFLNGSGIIGDDWEWEFKDSDLTHWTELPELPKEG